MGDKPVTKTSDSTVDLGMIVRDIDELIVINDEAHHLHDDKSAWVKSIADMGNRLKQKGTKLSLQIDLTTTPKRMTALFLCKLFLIIRLLKQSIKSGKKSVVPDAARRGKLKENQSTLFSRKIQRLYKSCVEEWQKHRRGVKTDGPEIYSFYHDQTIQRIVMRVMEYIETSFKN